MIFFLRKVEVREFAVVFPRCLVVCLSGFDFVSEVAKMDSLAVKSNSSPKPAPLLGPVDTFVA